MLSKRLDIASLNLEKGAFTRQAKRKGMTVPQFTREVLMKKNTDKYSTLTKQRARLAKTLSKIKK